MLLSEALKQFEHLPEHNLIFDGRVLTPSKFVLFLCDILSIIRKSKKDLTKENLVQIVSEMMTQRTVEQIPDLSIPYDETVEYDHHIKNIYSIHTETEKRQFVFCSSQDPLLNALQMMHQGSVVFVDEDYKHIVAQFQTRYYRQILRRNAVNILLEPAYKFFTRMNSDSEVCMPTYIVWDENGGKKKVMEENQLDYALIIEGEGVKGVREAVWL